MRRERRDAKNKREIVLSIVIKKRLVIKTPKKRGMPPPRGTGFV